MVFLAATRADRERLATSNHMRNNRSGLISNRRLAGYWDSVALTEAEDYATEALKLVLGDNVERIAVVGDDLARTTRVGEL